MTRRSLKLALSAAALTLSPMIALAQTAEAEPNYIIIFSGMALGLIIVALVLHTIARVQEARFETIRTMAEKGQEIPPQLLGPHHRHGPPREKATLEEAAGMSLGWGILFFFFGVGVGLANFLSSGDLSSAAWGLIFIFLGFGLMTNCAIVRRGLRRQAQDGDR